MFTAGGNVLTPQEPTDGARIINVTNQFDPFADAPKNILNIVADLNWLASGFYGNPYDPSISPHVYDHNPVSDVTGTNDIVTTHGNLTDVLVLSPVGGLPLMAALVQNHLMSQRAATELDPVLRSIIMAAYAPSADPAARVTFLSIPVTPPPKPVPAQIDSSVARAPRTGRAAAANTVAAPQERQSQHRGHPRS